MEEEGFQEKIKESVEKLVEVDGEPETPSPATDSLIGKTIARHYLIEAQIGEGGMSKVFRARHTHLERPVAIKFVHKRLLSDGKTIDRFKQEARAASELNHPNICSVKEYGLEEDGAAFLVMDYLEGESLDKTISRDGPMDFTRALGIFRQVLEGMGHAHARGVIHRDIKPANILLSQNSDVHVLDFGIAKLVREDETGPNLTKTGDVFGTPNFMSPEQSLGKNVDRRSDIYALGCLLYFMLKGSAPFESASVLETLMSHVNDRVEKIKGVPPVVNDLIQKCTAKDPEDRYQSIAELVEDVEKIQRGENIKAPVKSEGNFQSLYVLAAVSMAILILGSISYFLAGRLPYRQANTESSHQEFLMNPNKIWEARHHQGDLAHRSGNTEKAYSLYKEARELAEKNGAPETYLAFVNEEIGGCARYLDRKGEALEAYTKAASYYKNLGRKDAYQKVLGSIARIEFELKEYEAGVEHYEEILAMQKNSRHPVMMQYLERVGKACFIAGRYDLATRHFAQVIELGKRYPDKYRKELAISHWYYGKILERDGNYKLAVKEMELASKIGRLAWLPDEELKQIAKDLDTVRALAEE